MKLIFKEIKIHFLWHPSLIHIYFPPLQARCILNLKDYRKITRKLA